MAKTNIFPAKGDIVTVKTKLTDIRVTVDNDGIVRVFFKDRGYGWMMMRQFDKIVK